MQIYITNHLRGLVFVLLCGAASSASAQAVNPSDASANYQDAFEDLLLKADDPEISFRFAKEAVASGDIRGAIAAFERILRLNPSLANIKLELGVLYLRVGASELANKYISEALLSPGIPIAVRNRAKTIHKQAKKAASNNSFSFNVGLGLHSDENANAAPSSRDILVGGQPALLDEESLGRSDTAFSVSASAAHTFLFNSQSGNQLESSLSYNNKRFNESEEINFDYLSLKTGPRIFFGDLLSPGWSIKPFVEATQLKLDGEKYQETIDLGLNGTRVFSPTNIATFNLRYSDNEFFDSPTRRAEQRSGSGYAADINLSNALRTNFQIFGGLGFALRSADADFESRTLLRANVGASIGYRSPFSKSKRWRSSLTLSQTETEYDEPDPAISLDENREESRVQATLSNYLGFTRNLYGTLTIYHTDNDASLPNFVYDNTGGNFTLWYTF